jgi:hypothetical protein
MEDIHRVIAEQMATPEQQGAEQQALVNQAYNRFLPSADPLARHRDAVMSASRDRSPS